MIATVFWVMAMSLWRDRGALAMTFVTPPAIFVVFAAIFAATGGRALDLRVAFGASVASDEALVVEAALRTDGGLRLGPRLADAEAVRRAVRDGRADVGLHLRGDLSAADAPALIVVDPAKRVAGDALEGRLRGAVAATLPRVAVARAVRTLAPALGGLTPEQQARLAAAGVGRGDPAADLVEIETLDADLGPDPAVTYYAGAIAILFLLFSACQQAASLIDERDAGVLDRIVAGPGGTDALIAGKFAFLTALGAAQASAIFAVAALGYGVPVTANLAAWAVATALAAAAAAGFGLLLAALATSRAQAQTLATFTVLVFSAVGGSMAPRFLMPGWLQDLGWLTPNAWTVDLYEGILARDLGLWALAPQIAALAALAIGGVAAAGVVSRRRVRL